MTKVLLIGDSISLDYGKYLPRFLPENILVYDKPSDEDAYVDLDTPLGGNGGDSSMVLDFLRTADQQTLSCDWFFFNCGLHDIKHDRTTDAIQIPLENYKQNLEQILALMVEKGIKTVFINSTPTSTLRHSKVKIFYRLEEDVPVYNKAAEEVMAAHNIPVIDLYSFTKALNLEEEELFRDHTHFTRPVMQLHAAFLAGYLNAGCHPVM